MKYCKKSALLLFFTLLLCFSASAQKEWLGAYEFDEDGGRTAGGTAITISHRIEIVESADGLLAMVRSNGYQTSKDLVCLAKPQGGGKLLLYFESYGEDNVFEPYAKGDLLLTLERKTAGGKTEILTHWNKFTPIVPKNEKSGKVYFQKQDAPDPLL
jgi:hypothetical protein